MSDPKQSQTDFSREEDICWEGIEAIFRAAYIRTKCTHPEKLEGAYLYAGNACLINAVTGETLLEKAADEQAEPASTTKIITLLTALASCDPDATVVVEAGRGSGALITAKLALAQGRKLFAVPGRIGDEGAEGTNDLIREGALPAVHPEDVLAEFEFLYKSVNLPLAHSRMRNLDFERLSLEAMQRTRIGTQGTGGPRTSGSPGT